MHAIKFGDLKVGKKFSYDAPDFIETDFKKIEPFGDRYFDECGCHGKNNAESISGFSVAHFCPSDLVQVS